MTWLSINDDLWEQKWNKKDIEKIYVYITQKMWIYSEYFSLIIDWKIFFSFSRILVEDILNKKFSNLFLWNDISSKFKLILK